MGSLIRLGLGVTWLSWTGIATAESAPAPAQWSAPAPPTATAAPSASAPPPSPSPSPNVPVPVPDSAPPSAPAPAPAPPAAPPPVAYPYPLYPAPPPYPYPYGYYYPPQYAPPAPTLRYPDNSATHSTPFFDLLLGSLSWQNRLSQSINVGAQVGVYLADRVRLTLRGAIPTDKLNDTYYFGRSKDASFLYGASAGIVVLGAKTFVLSPGAALMRSDVSDYGTMIALSLPFEWVLPTGMRVGLELDLGRAVAGHTGGGTFMDRPAGTGLWLHFQLGYGFNHPAPLPPEPPQMAPTPPAPR